MSLKRICCKCGGIRREYLSLSDNCELCSCSTSCKQEFHAHPRMRYLKYNLIGGDLAPHTDLSKTMLDGICKQPRTSTHTFIIYLSTSVDYTGETVLLDKHRSNNICTNKTIASVTPVHNRLLVFPHICPHAGLPILTPPKVL